MFLTNWIQRSYIIYAVITLTLLPSVQLLASRKHSLVRRNYRHNCDVQYMNVPFFPEAKCIGTDGIRYSCKKESCNKGKLSISLLSQDF
ncbi:hypothetical protein PGT21_030886 [Puccinia graminis f. sp. tritici]|uniref:Uncharacterized protein n=1 Tax=Puccinia graminis f. sp. tritici TaxID=56615 RepID=A0A5B0PZ72_PUCGR|nr:hypothetical protein PGT21_030886 [Puccinia graminis f. sp. tritici]KAA1109254.1 hypothetical protein PGTUg99_023220 [Puccinia graminis f. sp. tritici]